MVSTPLLTYHMDIKQSPRGDQYRILKYVCKKSRTFYRLHRSNDTAYVRRCNLYFTEQYIMAIQPRHSQHYINRQQAADNSECRVRVLKNRFTGWLGVAGIVKYYEKTGRMLELSDASAIKDDPIESDF